MANHRLMCGDATMIDDVEKVMKGEKADMVFTDPPYNTGMTPESQSSANGNTLWKGNKKGNGWLGHMFSDDYTDEEWQQFMADFCLIYWSQMKENTGAYICLDWRRNYELIPHIKKHFKLSNTVVWDKVVHGLGSDYKYTYELINVCKKGKPEMDTHQGDREYSDVWHIQRKIGKNKEHATAKPVEIVERCMRHASKPNSIVIDYFMGSGTTLISAQKNNRICYGLELSEQYCDVIVKRWQDWTGEKATLESSGELFER
jgi:DNA modification methylase